MSDDSDQYEVPNLEIDHKKHDKLVENILNLNKVQNVKKPSRTEPSIQISEFNLVKTLTGNKGSIQLNELTKVLKSRRKHEEISKKLQSTSTKSKTLPTPLARPQAERIRRSLNYEKSRLELDRWEALVASNRAASHLKFPLDSIEKVKFEEKKSLVYPSTFRLKSDLQKALEKLEPKVEEYKIETKEVDEFPLTLEELKEKRKEAAKLRAHQSFKEAKARRQNKIKSKKYHRILRREKIKKKLKEFEELQKTNPEEALKKLDDIEKARAEERFSLRHKGTGQWARNKQVRAKYDKESRQVLAQQLAISRDLTQKVKSADSDSDEDDTEIQGNQTKRPKNEDSNPWINGVKAGKDVVDFVSGYRKYWNDKNKAQNMEDNCDEKENEEAEIDNKTLQLEEIAGKKSPRKNIQIKNGQNKCNTSANSSENETKLTQTLKSTNDNSKNKKKKRQKMNLSDPAAVAAVNGISNKRKRIPSQGTSDWDVEDIFENLERKLKKKMTGKLNKVKAESKKKLKTRLKEKKVNNKIDLSMPSKSKKHLIDEAMIEKSKDNEADDDNTLEVNKLKDILNSAVEEHTADINPEKFFKPRNPTSLNAPLPDMVTTEENEENTDQRDIIMEAFEDDDIADDFEKEKADEIKKDTPKDIDLNLPGWGSWAGANIDPNKRKRKRFITKMPAKVPRRDDNKGSLIINEKAQAKIKPLLVSEVPFPFKTVKDYEASIRAPIGNTFVPETAFRKLIEPAVTTKMGTIIEPISKSILVGKKRG